MPTNAEASAKTLYDKELCSKYKILTRSFLYPRGIRNFIFHRIPIRENDKILDAGSGDGILSRAIRDKIVEQGIAGAKQYAFDISEDMLQGFREMGATGIDLRRHDVRELSYDDDYFDLIITSAMLEYVPDIENGLASLKRCLKPGGRIFIFMSKRTRLNGFLFQPFGNPRCYSFKELRDAIANAGFKDIKRLRFPLTSCWLNLWGNIVEATK